jgi:hypothetical protein
MILMNVSKETLVTMEELVITMTDHTLVIVQQNGQVLNVKAM